MTYKIEQLTKVTNNLFNNKCEIQTHPSAKVELRVLRRTSFGAAAAPGTHARLIAFSTN